MSDLAHHQTEEVQQGRNQDLAEGPRIIYFKFGNLHVAQLGGSGACPWRNFLNGAIWCIFASDFSKIKFFYIIIFKNYHFLYKNTCYFHR